MSVAGLVISMVHQQKVVAVLVFQLWSPLHDEHGGGWSLLQAPVVGRWSDAYGRKPFLVLSFACGGAQVVALLLSITMGTSLFWYFPAQVWGPHHFPSRCLDAFHADRPVKKGSCQSS